MYPSLRNHIWGTLRNKNFKQEHRGPCDETNRLDISFTASVVGVTP